MLLRNWLIRDYELTLDTTAEMSGEELVNALCSRMTAAGFDFDKQKSILLDAPDNYCDTDFFEACINRVNKIENLQKQHQAAKQRHQAQCRNGGDKKRVRVPAAEFAIYRYAPTDDWPSTDESATLVDDMLKKIADKSYINPAADTLLDLRQSLGFYRPREDPGRLRRPVRWLGNLNVLHYWLCTLLGDHDPPALITTIKGGGKRWETAASIFADKKGNALTYNRIEHGELSDPKLCQFLDSTVPLRPRSVTAQR